MGLGGTSVREPRQRLIVTGTDPEEPRGGIGVAMSGFLEAMRREDLVYAFVPTYHPTRPHGKWKLALTGLTRVVQTVREVRRQGDVPVTYSHAGGPRSLIRESLLLHAAKFAGSQTMIQLHSPHVERILATPTKREVFKAMLRVCDRVCVLTPYWQRQLERHGVRRPVALVPDPLPTFAEEEARRPLAPDRHTSADLRVLTMTRLETGKGVDVAIRAMRHLDGSIRLSVAGEGSQRDAYERLAREIGVADRVDFLGWVAGEDKLALLGGADVFCLPTTWDSFGMGFLESAAFGVPAVAIRRGAVPDVVDEGRTALLTATGDPVEIARTIERLRDPGHRRKMGLAAKQWVLQEYSIDAVGQKIRAALPELPRG